MKIINSGCDAKSLLINADDVDFLHRPNKVITSAYFWHNKKQEISTISNMLLTANLQNRKILIKSLIFLQVTAPKKVIYIACRLQYIQLDSWNLNIFLYLSCLSQALLSQRIKKIHLLMSYILYS